MMDGPINLRCDVCFSCSRIYLVLVFKIHPLLFRVVKILSCHILKFTIRLIVMKDLHRTLPHQLLLSFHILAPPPSSLAHQFIFLNLSSFVLLPLLKPPPPPPPKKNFNIYCQEQQNTRTVTCFKLLYNLPFVTVWFHFLLLDL